MIVHLKLMCNMCMYVLFYNCLQDVYGVVERIRTISHQLRILATQEATKQRGTIIVLKCLE